MNEFMRQAGAEPREVRLDDGAGLSRSALVTPNAIVQLLRYMTRHTEAQAFRNALPEPGGDGTLRNRLTDLKGRLSAKTGSFRFVDTLAGYLKSAGGDELAFAIMLNAYDPPNGRSSRDEIDAVVRLTARLGKLQ
jgi:D-alanyl-D-alanine carboxypeptidase/D-alanyl-D-alanine-endopeptidase (penicillin-binding protein 4)